MAKVFFHVDLDAFFASVEQLDHPEYRGKPVIIGALPGHRGVVAASSYEARAFGVRSAMPISFAVRRCPNGIYLPVRMERYQEMSRRVMDLLDSYTPEVIQISVDEASLDMTGTQRLLGPPLVAGRKLKDSVRADCGLTISVGIAPNRYLAKLASDAEKPDGLFQIEAGSEIAFLDRLPLRDLWGIGKKTLARLTELGIDTTAALRDTPLDALREMIGSAGGDFLYKIVRGIDPGIYSQERRTHSISNEVTFEEDIREIEQIRMTVLDLSHQVMFRIKEEGARPKTVTVKIRYGDFTTTTAQTTLRRPLSTAEELNRHALELFTSRWTGEAVRLLGVGVSLTEGDAEPLQSELFEDGTERRRKLEQAVFDIQVQGRPVVKASLLGRKPRQRPKLT